MAAAIDAISDIFLILPDFTFCPRLRPDSNETLTDCRHRLGIVGYGRPRLFLAGGLVTSNGRSPRRGSCMISRLRRAFWIQLVPLSVGFAVLAVIVGGRSLLIETQRAENDAVRTAFELERQLVTVLSTLQDAETGQRGYLLTGEDRYLDPYNRAIGSLPEQLTTIREELADRPGRLSQFAVLESAIGEKLVELAQTVSLQQTGDGAGALALVRTDRGQVLMDRVRLALGNLWRDEHDELQTRLASSERVDGLLRVASIVSLLAVFFIGAYGLLYARRRMKDVIEAHASLSASHEALSDEIATRQKAEATVRQMQKMEAIGQLTGGIAHDFNNMLAVILSAMNLIQRKLARGETDIAKFVEAATDATTRAAALTARLLAFSRQQPLQPQIIDANRMVTGMSDLLRRALGEAISIETVLSGGLWRTFADPSQLENAILNLAVNARDAMPDGGSLTIETSNAHLDSYAATHPEVTPGQYVMVAVTDTGTGMSPDIVAKAFEPFFTTKSVDKGTGLGLSQVFGFVKQSGGHVKIYSEPGEGTTIKIYLKRHFGDEAEMPVPAVVVSPAVRPTEIVLVVEDDERVRDGSVHALRELGYSVIHAGDAAEALRKLEQHPEISLLFTDIIMPVMNGRKLAEEALKRRPNLKVLFTTGFTKNAVVHNGVLDPGVNFLAKPFTIEQLAAKVREALEK
jgi:signal transduction histidine kinase